MADKIKIHSVKNANIYANGNNWLGRAIEIQVPEVAYKMQDHEALGMVGMTELFSGIDKMEAVIKWNSFYSDVLKKVANPMQPIQLTVRANMDIVTGGGVTDQVPVRIFMTCWPKNLPSFTFKQHENTEAESKFNTTSYKLQIGNEVITEIDILNNIFKVDGVNLLAKYNQNIGA